MAIRAEAIPRLKLPKKPSFSLITPETAMPESFFSIKMYSLKLLENRFCYVVFNSQMFNATEVQL
jgi:hypothetical protein